MGSSPKDKGIKHSRRMKNFKKIHNITFGPILCNSASMMSVIISNNLLPFLSWDRGITQTLPSWKHTLGLVFGCILTVLCRSKFMAGYSENWASLGIAKAHKKSRTIFGWGIKANVSHTERLTNHDHWKNTETKASTKSFR